MIQQINLIIFDCDGVLVNSEPIIIGVLAEMLQEIGHPVKMNDLYSDFHGRSTAQWITQIATMLGNKQTATFIPLLKARAAAALWAKITPIPGIVDALDAIQTPICVASSGDHAKMQLTLGKTGLLPRFGNNIFSVNDVLRPKPFPDVYLHAAQQNNVSPANCVVIEDSPTGVRAGVAAGMIVFGYCAQTDKEQLLAAGAHHLFSDMHQLPGLLTTVGFLQRETRDRPLQSK